MPLFPYGLFNKKASQDLVEALRALVQSPTAFERGFAENEPELIGKIKQALISGANPNISLAAHSFPSFFGRPAHPLALAIYFSHPDLVEIFLAHNATKTASQNPAKIWLQHATDILNMHSSQITPTRKSMQEDIVKIGHMLVTHPFFVKAINSESMRQIQYRASSEMDEPYMEKVLQILVDASSDKNLLRFGTGWGVWLPQDLEHIFRQCVLTKQSFTMRKHLTKVVDQNEKQPTRNRKL